MNAKGLITSLLWLVYLTGYALSLPWSLVDQEEDGLYRASRSSHEVEGASCGYFIEYQGKSLFGYNTDRIEDITLEQCLEKCAKARNFYCRSVDFNPDSASSGDHTTCFLSSENQSTQPDALDTNFNTNHYERSCADPNAEEGGSGNQVSQ